MSDNTQDLLTAALHNWTIGQPEQLKEFLSERMDLLDTYKGPGEIASYFAPALYLEDFCADLIEVGFPVEEIFAKYPGDFKWIDWPIAVDRVVQFDRQILVDLMEGGPLSGDEIFDLDPMAAQIDRDDENVEILFDYWPQPIQDAVRREAQAFANSGNEKWRQRFETAELAHATVRHAATP